MALASAPGGLWYLMLREAGTSHTSCHTKGNDCFQLGVAMPIACFRESTVAGLCLPEQKHPSKLEHKISYIVCSPKVGSL